MNRDDDGPLLAVSKTQPSIITDQATSPAAEPSSPVGATTTVNLSLTVPAEAMAAVVTVVDTIGIGGLLSSLAPAAPAAKPKSSHPAAQAMVAGLLRGLGEKYQDPALSAAGRQLEARLLGFPTAAAAKPQPSKFKPPRNPRREGKGKNKRR